MTSSAHFYSDTYNQASDLPISVNSVLFHGDAVDDRGELAIALNNAIPIQKIHVAYDIERMETTIGTNRAEEISTLIEGLIQGQNVILEATTLGFSELFLIVRALVQLKVYSFQIIYVEPRDYNRSIPGGDSFELSELTVGYKPIPHAVVDLYGDDVEVGVFFLGYEPERLDRALEEYQMIKTKELKVIFGVPAFQAGWELNSIVPHLPVLNEGKSINIAYCSANDPGAAYDCLEDTRGSLSTGASMFIGPIGTKPCGIATAIFASLFPDQVGLLYDHPKKKRKRTSGVSIWHRYSIRISI